MPLLTVDLAKGSENPSVQRVTSTPSAAGAELMLTVPAKIWGSTVESTGGSGVKAVFGDTFVRGANIVLKSGVGSILWRDGDHAEEAAAALKLTAPNLLELGVIDAIIPEPLGGAHRDRAAAFAAVGEAITGALKAHAGIDGDTLRERRRQRFLEIGRKGLS